LSKRFTSKNPSTRQGKRGRLRKKDITQKHERGWTFRAQGEMRCAYKTSMEDHLGDLGIDGRIIFWMIEQQLAEAQTGLNASELS
jgi:hypothetical protein